MSNHVKITIDTYDRIASDYKMTAIPEIRAWEEGSMKIFREMLPGTSVLVPGCGDGRDSRFLKSLGLSVTSFDLSEGMISQAKKDDPDGIYKNLDIREIITLTGPFDGIYASGCLYHITRSEFKDFFSSASSIMSDQGVLYLNMKIGVGNEIKTIPGNNYPGGVEAQTSLIGSRYYEYYTHEELLGFFTDFKVIKWRNMEVQKEGVNEYWLISHTKTRRHKVKMIQNK